MTSSRPDTRHLANMKKLIVIGGATASGKTAFAIQLAQHFETEILSADSRQFYKGMDIGTAKPTAAELAAVPHHFIDSLEVTQSYSVGDFERDALAVLENLFLKSDFAVLVGGSGLFLRAVCEGLDSFPEVSEKVKNEVENQFFEKEKTAVGSGLAWLQTEVERLDPAQFSKMDSQNPMRLRRVLEVCLETGLPYSAFLEREKTPRPFEPIYLLLDPPREVLYSKIEARVDAMVAAGLEAEARKFYPLRHLPALRTVGYEEWFDFFDGKMSREEAILKIKQHTRNYAKRQGTWFRKYGQWRVVDSSDADLTNLQAQILTDFS